MVEVEATEKAIRWAMDELNKQPYNPNRFNSCETILAEQWKGAMTAGATVYKCKPGDGSTWNVDYDNRCECCGELHEMGSIDFTPETVRQTAETIVAKLQHCSFCC